MMRMTVRANTTDVLLRLSENRAKHATMVEEAQAGYLKKAEHALLERLAQLREGQVLSLSFGLTLPASHIREYDTAIRMLQMHTEPTIDLSTDQVRAFIEDDWDWKHSFLFSNQLYSDAARDAFERHNEG